MWGFQLVDNNLFSPFSDYKKNDKITYKFSKDKYAKFLQFRLKK